MPSYKSSYTKGQISYSFLHMKYVWLFDTMVTDVNGNRSCIQQSARNTRIPARYYIIQKYIEYYMFRTKRFIGFPLSVIVFVCVCYYLLVFPRQPIRNEWLFNNSATTKIEQS